MITKIGDLLKEIIPNFDELEIIYTEHYISHTGYDKTNHLLMIRNCMYCYEGCIMPFDLDTSKVISTLEEELPVEVEFDKIITIDKGTTYKFYMRLTEEED